MWPKIMQLVAILAGVAVLSAASPQRHTGREPGRLDAVRAACGRRTRLRPHREARRRGDDQLRLGFTYAYRFDPTIDAGMFEALRRGGRAFRRAFVRDHLMALGGLGRRVPIWITEAGYDTIPGVTGYDRQRTALRQIVTTVARAAARDDVTDLRWFDLRDSGPDATGFGERSGLLTAGYRRKPAFGAYRALIARYGARRLSSPVADVGHAN